MGLKTKNFGHFTGKNSDFPISEIWENFGKFPNFGTRLGNTGSKIGNLSRATPTKKINYHLFPNFGKQSQKIPILEVFRKTWNFNGKYFTGKSQNCVK